MVHSWVWISDECMQWFGIVAQYTKHVRTWIAQSYKNIRLFIREALRRSKGFQSDIQIVFSEC